LSTSSGICPRLGIIGTPILIPTIPDDERANEETKKRKHGPKKRNGKTGTWIDMESSLRCREVNEHGELLRDSFDCIEARKIADRIRSLGLIKNSWEE